MLYWIMYDKIHATEIKIHVESCYYVQEHLKHLKTKTTVWHHANSLRDARTKAREISNNSHCEWREARCCIG